MIRFFGYACLAVICAAILAAAGIAAWFMADRKLPVEVVKTEVLTPTVKPGGKLVIRQTLRYIRDCSAHVDRVLYDSAKGESGQPAPHRKFLSDVDYSRPPRGLGLFGVTFEEDVPESFVPGEAQYRAIPSYACNPLQQYYWPITRDETVIRFTVAPP